MIAQWLYLAGSLCFAAGTVLVMVDQWLPGSAAIQLQDPVHTSPLDHDVQHTGCVISIEDGP